MERDEFVNGEERLHATKQVEAPYLMPPFCPALLCCKPQYDLTIFCFGVLVTFQKSTRILPQAVNRFSRLAGCYEGERATLFLFFLFSL